MHLIVKDARAFVTLQTMPYRPVPKGLWWALGANVFMILWNMTFLVIWGRFLDVFLVTVSSCCCIFLLASIANWRSTFPRQ